MELQFLNQLIGWLRGGYPHGVPESDYVPLFALLSRRLSDEEVCQIADALVEQGVIPIDKADLLVMITKVTDDLPREADIERVAAVLTAQGLPVVGIDPAEPTDGPGCDHDRTEPE